MKSKVYEDWAAGVDRRRDRSMTEPDRLWNLKNAYIDDGGRMVTRPGVYKVGTLNNCDGLMLYNGVLYTFAITGAAPAPSATFATIITLGAGPAGQTTIKRVWFAQPFNTGYYVVLEFSDGVISHYVNTTRVTDANCPNTKIVTIAGQRIYCANATGYVRYSVLNNGADWTTAGSTGAGFLPVASQAAGMGLNCTGLGTYQSDLVVFLEKGCQVWYPDVDNTKIFIRQRIYNVGMNSIPGPLASAPFGEDLAFLGQDGIRSLSVSQNTSNRVEQDIGAPVRDLPIGIQTYSASPGPYYHYQLYPQGNVNSLAMDPVEAVYVSGLAQLWFVWPHVSDAQTGDVTNPLTTDQGDGRSAVVAMSYGAGRKSWSLFNFPLRMKNLVDGSEGNKAYCLQNTATSAPYNPTLWVMRLNYVDFDASFNAVPINVGAEWPFLDCDSPGGMKHFKAMDTVGWPVGGYASIKYLYDPNDETKETIAQSIALGDSRGRGLASVEVSAPSIAPVLTYATGSSDTSRFRFSAMQLYYEADAGPK